MVWVIHSDNVDEIARGSKGNHWRVKTPAQVDVDGGQEATDYSPTRTMAFAHHRDNAEDIARVLKRNEPRICFLPEFLIRDCRGAIDRDRVASLGPHRSPTTVRRKWQESWNARGQQLVRLSL